MFVPIFHLSGVRDAVKQSNFSKPQPGFLENLLGPTFASKDPAVVEGLPVTEFLLEGEHPFKAFAPEMFRELRQNEGIDDEFYLRVLSSTANERLSEGASGAFMFFCGGKKRTNFSSITAQLCLCFVISARRRVHRQNNTRTRSASAACFDAYIFRVPASEQKFTVVPFFRELQVGATLG